MGKILEQPVLVTRKVAFCGILWRAIHYYDSYLLNSAIHLQLNMIFTPQISSYNSYLLDFVRIGAFS